MQLWKTWRPAFSCRIVLYLNRSPTGCPCLPATRHSTGHGLTRQISLKSTHIGGVTYLGSDSISAGRETVVEPPNLNSLLRCLSPDAVTMSSPEVPTAASLKAIYLSMTGKRRRMVFSHRELSTLIALFSTLSLTRLTSLRYLVSSGLISLTSPFAYHPLAAKMDDASFGSHAPFVRKIAEHKKEYAYGLSDPDQYWLMRLACQDLLSLRRNQSSESNTPPSLQSYIAKARKAYLSLRSPYPIWDAHYHYINAIISTGSVSFLEEATTRIANLVTWHEGLHVRILPALWQLIPQYPPSGQAKSNLLHNLRLKVSKHQYDLPLQRDVTINQSMYIDGSPTFKRSELIQPIDAHSLRDAFTAILFLHESAASRRAIPNDLRNWALAEIQGAFRAHSGFDRADTSQDELMWHNLSLLSLTYNTNGPNFTNMQGIDLGHPESGAEVVDWVLVCAMVATQNLLARWADSHPDTPVDRAQALVRTIWVLWRRDSGKRIRPASALCCAAVSFMRLAIFTRDNGLYDSITRYIGDAIVVPIILREMVCDPQSWRSLSVEFATMSAMFGVQSFIEMFDILRANRLEISHIGTDGWRNVLANSVVKNLLQYDAGVALRLYHSSQEAEVELWEPVLVDLCKASIASGYLLQALKILRSAKLTEPSRKVLMDTTVDHLTTANVFDAKLARTLSNTFNTLAQSDIYPSKAKSCELMTLSMVEAGFAPEATSMVIAIGKSKPDFFHAAFLQQFGRRLMLGRHYGCMKQLIRSGFTTQPLRTSLDRKHDLKPSDLPLHRILAKIQERAPPFPELVQNSVRDSRRKTLLEKRRHRRRGLTRRGAKQTRIPARTPSKSVTTDIITLKMMDDVSKAGKLDTKSLERVLYILIRSGRVVAAQKILNRLGLSGFTTKAGNIMLTGSFVPRRSLRNKRQVQHVMRRLSSLIQERGFAPDRVTLNLLVMARLRWDSVTNKETARVLFDRLICAEYPDGSGLQPPDGPFQTGQTASVSNPENIGKPRQILMSYSRHIRPLYKIFIKAFIDRGDFEAARTVKEILERVRQDMAAEASRREKARMMGQIKAHERRAETVKQNKRERRRRWRSKRRAMEAVLVDDLKGSAVNDTI